jgi:hypothetical protein
MGAVSPGTFFVVMVYLDWVEFTQMFVMQFHTHTILRLYEDFDPNAVKKKKNSSTHITQFS